MNALPRQFRRYLVTGGAGFIGSHVVDQQIAGRAGRVTVIDDFTTRDSHRNRHPEVCRLASCPKAKRGCRVIV